jgi:2-(1,2-epoxy-1,2-dihydrophenyl)acetyl-CoA isomerase
MSIRTIDTGTTDLLATLDDGVLVLTLNRPEARNAMSAAMNAALSDQLAKAELDNEVKVIVLTGAGRLPRAMAPSATTPSIRRSTSSA